MNRSLLFLFFFFIAISPEPGLASPFSILDERRWKLSYSFYIENPSLEKREIEIAITLVPTDSPSQRVIVCKFPCSPMGIERDAHGNEIGVWKLVILPGEKKLLAFSYEIETRHVRWDGPVKASYTGPAKRVLPLEESPPGALRDAASKISGKEKYPYYRSLVLYDHILTHYHFSPHEKKYGALEALGNKTIQCADAALLYRELVLASGIPSRFVGGLYITPGRNYYHDYHAWTEVLLPGYSWAAVDPTLGRFESGHRLRCFLERRDGYIKLWTGVREPFEIRRGRETDPKTGVSFLISVTPISQGRSIPPVQAPAALDLHYRALPGPPKSHWKTAANRSGYEHYGAGKRLETENASKWAVNEYFRALDASPCFPEPVKALIRIYDSGIQKDEIYQGLKTKTRLTPNNPLAWYALGELERRLNSYSASAEALDRAQALGFIGSDLFLSKMCLYEKTKEIRLFEIALKSCLSVDEGNLEAHRKALLFYQDLELWEHCIYWASRGKRKLPAYAIFPGMEGFAHMRKGELKKARSSIEEAIRKDPAMGWYHCISGWIFLKEGDRISAKKEIDKGIMLRRGVENPDFFRSLLTSPEK